MDGEERAVTRGRRGTGGKRSESDEPDNMSRLATKGGRR